MLRSLIFILFTLNISAQVSLRTDLLTGADIGGVWSQCGGQSVGALIGDNPIVDFSPLPFGEYCFKYFIANDWFPDSATTYFYHMDVGDFTPNDVTICLDSSYALLDSFTVATIGNNASYSFDIGTGTFPNNTYTGTVIGTQNGTLTCTPVNPDITKYTLDPNCIPIDYTFVITTIDCSCEGLIGSPSIAIGDSVCQTIDPPTLSIANVTGCVGGISYQWQQSNNGAPFTDIAGATSNTYDPPSFSATFTDVEIRYQVIVSCSLEGCEQSLTSNIATFVALGMPNVNSTTTADETCDNEDGLISLTVSGKVPITFSWTGPNGFTSNLQNITNLEAGSYTVVLTDRDGCTNTYTYIIGSNLNGCCDSLAGNATLNITDQQQCGGTISGATISVSGYTGCGGQEVFQWQESTDGLTFNNVGTNSPNYTFSTFSSGIKAWRVLISCGCDNSTLASNIVTYEIYDLPSVFAGSDESICTSDLATCLNGTASGSGGTYSWSVTGGGNISYGSTAFCGSAPNNIIIVSADVGTYTFTLTLTDANGCQDSDSKIVTITDCTDCTCSVDMLANVNNCTATIDINGCSSYNSFILQRSTDCFTTPNTTVQTGLFDGQVINISTDGNYRVVATSNQNCPTQTSGNYCFDGCGATPCNSSVTLTENNCILTATISGTACPSAIYRWYRNGNLVTTTFTNNITINLDGFWTVEVDSCPDCGTLNDNINVTGCEVIVDCNCSPTFTFDAINCEVDVTMTGTGCGNYTYTVLNWGPGAGCSIGSSTVAFNQSGNNSYAVNQDGWYQVLFTPSNGCGGIAPICIEVTGCEGCNEEIDINISSTLTNTSCSPAFSTHTDWRFNMLIDFDIDCPSCCNATTVTIAPFYIINGIKTAAGGNFQVSCGFNNSGLANSIDVPLSSLNNGDFVQVGYDYTVNGGCPTNVTTQILESATYNCDCDSQMGSLTNVPTVLSFDCSTFGGILESELAVFECDECCPDILLVYGVTLVNTTTNQSWSTTNRPRIGCEEPNVELDLNFCDITGGNPTPGDYIVEFDYQSALFGDGCDPVGQDFISGPLTITQADIDNCCGVGGNIFTPKKVNQDSKGKAFLTVLGLIFLILFISDRLNEKNG